LEPAPGLLSTMKVCPIRSVSAWATMRATMSASRPAESRPRGAPAASDSRARARLQQRRCRYGSAGQLQNSAACGAHDVPKFFFQAERRLHRRSDHPIGQFIGYASRLVPLAAGGGADIVARVLAEQIGRAQNVTAWSRTVPAPAP
jgi:hypothetical protein